MLTETDYNKWLKTKAYRGKKWPKLTREQKWFVFVNAVEKPPTRAVVASLDKLPPGMVWSFNRKVK